MTKILEATGVPMKTFSIRFFFYAGVLFLLLNDSGTALATDHSEVKEPDARSAADAGDEKEKPPVELEEVVRRLEELYRADSSIARVQLKIIRPDRERTLDMKIWTRGDEKALVLIQAPPREKGIATLKVGDNLWNYLPRIDRTIRIPPSMMLASWMGSDFTNDDLVQESNLMEDYTPSIIGPGDEPGYWDIRLSVKPGVVGLWERIEFTVTVAPILPVKAEYYDRKGRLARIMHFDQVRNFDERRIPSRISLIPKDEEKKGHKTVMIYEDISFNVEVPQQIFSLANLEQKR